MTQQRLLIREIIYLSKKHLTAEEIYLIAKERMPKIALGTVYRNLGKLCESREIRQISIKGFSDCYYKSVLPHGHLICERCGSVTDFPLDDVRQAIEKTLGTEVLSYDLNAHYICQSCKAAAAQGDKKTGDY